VHRTCHTAEWENRTRFSPREPCGSWFAGQAANEAFASCQTRAIGAPTIDVHDSGHGNAFAVAAARAAERVQVTRPGGHISLKTSSTQDHALIEVEDECGGQLRVRDLPGVGCKGHTPAERQALRRSVLHSHCRSGGAYTSSRLGAS
jgi:hypothetical protein